MGVVAALFGSGLAEAFEVAADGGQHWPESAAGYVPGVTQIFTAVGAAGHDAGSCCSVGEQCVNAVSLYHGSSS